MHGTDARGNKTAPLAVRRAQRRHQAVVIGVPDECRFGPRQRHDKRMRRRCEQKVDAVVRSKCGHQEAALRDNDARAQRQQQVRPERVPRKRSG